MEYLIETMWICLESASARMRHWAIEKVATELSRTNEDDNVAKTLEEKLLCLKFMEACLGQMEGPQIFLQRKEWDNTWRTLLIPLATEERNPILAQISTRCVIAILLYSPDKSSGSELRVDEARVLTNLLLSDLAATVEQAVELLHNILLQQKSSGQCIAKSIDSTTELRNLIEALVRAETNHQLSLETADKLAHSFLLLIRKITDCHFLARGGSLMLLVRIVGGSFQGVHMNDRGIRTIALSVLLQLAKNPCNRRILAKTQGLLSSMIRHTRNHRPDDTIQISRDEMKQRIFQLAESL
jgi:hypothetical protein